jgi:hypothetical protein
MEQEQVVMEVAAAILPARAETAGGMMNIQTGTGSVIRIPGIKRFENATLLKLKN